METETIYVILALTTICGFLIGNFTSPSVRMAKKEIGYWRGLTGDFKKQLKAEKRTENTGGIENLLEGDMSIGNILKFVKNNPQIIEQVKGLVANGLQSKPAIDDRTGLGSKFR